MIKILIHTLACALLLCAFSCQSPTQGGATANTVTEDTLVPAIAPDSLLLKYDASTIAKVRALNDKAFHLVMFKNMTDSLQKGVAYLNEALLLAPEAAPPRNNRIRAYTNLGQYANAQADLDTLLQYTPQNYTARAQKGMLYKKANEPAKAKQQFLLAYQLVLPRYQQTNDIEDYLGLLFLKSQLVGKAPVMQSMDSLLAIYPEKDSIIDFVKMGIEQAHEQ